MFLSLRPTGVSLLIGFIDIGPGEVPHYIEDLSKSVNELRSSLKQAGGAEGDENLANPEDYYKLNAYLGLGRSNLIILAKVREQGFANRMSFLGNVRGQTFIHAHDYAPILDFYELGDDNCIPLLDVLQDLGVSECIKVNNNTCTIKATKDEPKDKDYVCQVSDRHWGYCFASPENKREGTYYFGNLRSMTYERIYCGEIRLWENKPEDNNGEYQSSSETKYNELLYFTQFKLNIIPVLRVTQVFRLLAWLGTLLSVSVHRQSCKKEEKPSYCRVLFTDGYCDLGLLMRGYDILAMDSLVQSLQLLTLGDVYKLMGKFDLNSFVERCKERVYPDLDESTPLFVLSHTTPGVPYTVVRPDHVAKELQCEEGLDDANNKIRLFFNDYIKGFSSYHLADDSDLTMSTNIALVNSRTQVVHDDIKQLYSALNLKRPDENVLLKGRFDLELFPPKSTKFGEYLARLFLANVYLQRDGYITRRERSLIYERYNSPILDLQTSLRTKRKVESFPVREVVYPGLREDKTRLMSRWNIVKQEKGVGEKKPDKSLAGLQDWLSKTGEDNQNYYLDQYLRFVYGGWVSWQALRRFTATINLIDNYLSEPLLFDIYLDVRKYCNRILQRIFSGDIPNGLKKRTEFFQEFCGNGMVGSRETGSDDLKGAFNGPERFFCDLCDLLQEVLDQRQAGSFPDYERSVSRLTDLRIQHLKKIASFSWLADRIIHDFQEKISSEGKQYFYLTCFRNSPDVKINTQIGAIYLNEQCLTSNEQIIRLAHEVGHAIWHELAKKTDLGERDNSDLIILEEVFADLVVFRYCFGPLGGLLWRKYDNDPNRASRDPYLDFNLAWLFQIILMPRMIKVSSFKKTLIRLCAVYVLLCTDEISQLNRPENDSCVKQILEAFHEFLVRHKKKNQSFDGMLESHCEAWLSHINSVKESICLDDKKNINSSVWNVLEKLVVLNSVHPVRSAFSAHSSK